MRKHQIIAVLGLLLGSVSLVSQVARTHINTFASVPANCSVGDVYVKSGTSQGLYQCSATNVWSTAGLVQIAAVTLTDSQIKALPTTGITLVAAPGSGLRLNVVGIDVRADNSAGAYTNIDADGFISFFLGTNDYEGYIFNDSGAALTYLTDFMTGGNRRVWVNGTGSGFADMSVWAVVPDVRGAFEENLALKIVATNGGSGNFTGGNGANTWRVTVYYVITA